MGTARRTMKTAHIKQIETLEELRKLAIKAMRKNREITVGVYYGNGLRSEKTISFYKGKWGIWSSVDGSYSNYTDKQLSGLTIIPKAIEKKALYLEEVL
jgi:hypothetical protein